MRRRSLAVLVLLVSPVTSLAQETPSRQTGPTAEAASEVMRVVHGVFEGMRRVDSAMVRPLFHPEARLITVSTRDGTTAVRFERAEGFIQSVGRPRTEVWDERLSNEKVEIDGALASVWVEYEFYRGTTRSHCGIDHFLLVKDSGSWRIVELADTRRGCG